MLDNRRQQALLLLLVRPPGENIFHSQQNQQWKVLQPLFDVRALISPLLLKVINTLKMPSSNEHLSAVLHLYV